MWCDNFDMDLPKVIPNAEAICAPVRELKLYTTGRSSDGKLNHPAVWNGHRSMNAFFALGEGGAEPQPHGYFSSQPIIACTAWEAFRDAWPHHYSMQLRHRDSVGKDCFVEIWNTCDLNDRFTRLMYDLRGWQKLTDGRRCSDVAHVELTLRDAVARLQSVVGDAEYNHDKENRS